MRRRAGFVSNPGGFARIRDSGTRTRTHIGNINKSSPNQGAVVIVQRHPEVAVWGPQHSSLTSGSGFLKDEVDPFKSRLQIFHNEEFNARSHSRILDEDLKRPWAEAHKWTPGEKDRKEALDLIATTVRECLDRFMAMIAKNIDAKASPRKHHQDLEAIVRYYTSTPALEDLPLLSDGLDGAAQVGRIKASYAYIWDLIRQCKKKDQVGGSPSGFAWKMAMAELGDIKAKAMQGGNAAYVPYEALERVAVHRHFR